MVKQHGGTYSGDLLANTDYNIVAVFDENAPKTLDARAYLIPILKIQWLLACCSKATLLPITTEDLWDEQQKELVFLWQQ